MNDIIAFLIVSTVTVMALIGVFELGQDVADVPEHTIIKSCEDQGYWQYDQLRIDCFVEKPLHAEKTN